MHGQQDIARGVVRIVLRTGIRKLYDQTGQGLVANFIKRSAFDQILHHVGKLIDALQQRFGDLRRAIESARSQALHHPFELVHKIYDVRSTAIREVAFDRVHVPECAGQQIRVTGRLYQVVQIGDPVTFTATVTGGGSPVASGTVQFSDGGSNLGAPIALTADGTATFTTSGLVAGTHAIRASFAATATHGASSDDLDQVVDLAASLTTLTSSLNPSAFGDPVTFTATVTAAGAPVTSGTILSVTAISTPAWAPLAVGVAVAYGTHRLFKWLTDD